MKRYVNPTIDLEMERMAQNESSEKNHAQEQAKMQLESITEMVTELTAAEKSEVEQRMDNAREAIEQDALEVGIIKQYFILLCTGGPAVRIIGNLDETMTPDTARLQYQDWGTPWTDYPLTSDQEDTLIEYAQCYYFEGLDND